MDIYGYYEPDANHDQVRFCRRCFFASDSHNKIIGYPIAKDLDLRALSDAMLTLATRMFVINEKLFLFAIVDRYPFATCAKDIFV